MQKITTEQIKVQEKLCISPCIEVKVDCPNWRQEQMKVTSQMAFRGQTQSQ